MLGLGLWCRYLPYSSLSLSVTFTILTPSLPVTVTHLTVSSELPCKVLPNRPYMLPVTY